MRNAHRSAGSRSTRRPRRGLPHWLVVAGLLAPLMGAAQSTAPSRVSAAATLSVLAAPAAVQRVPAGSTAPQPAKDGSSLTVGDRVLTGPDAIALITFLDGSTVTVQPRSD